MRFHFHTRKSSFRKSLTSIDSVLTLNRNQLNKILSSLKASPSKESLSSYSKKKNEKRNKSHDLVFNLRRSSNLRRLINQSSIDCFTRIKRCEESYLRYLILIILSTLFRSLYNSVLDRHIVSYSKYLYTLNSVMPHYFWTSL